MPLRVLVGCEYSGIVRDAFLAAGHDALSCDLLPTESPGPHHQGDVRDLLDGWQPVAFAADCDPDGDGWCQETDTDPSACGCIGPTQDGMEYIEKGGVLFGRPESHPCWDMMIAHPPCTYLALSGLHWNNRIPGRREKTAEALDFVRLLLDAPIPRIAIENPVGAISTHIRKPDQYIQPWEYGHPESKKTGLWLVNLPKLQPTNILEPTRYQTNGVSPRWENQTATGQNKLGPSPDRWKLRSRFYEGWAEAMAEQWGGLS